MSSSSIVLPVVMAAAELVGTAIFATSKSNLRRAALSCFGLGFAACIVLVDVIPDAIEGHPFAFLTVALGIAVGLALVSQADKHASSVGNGAAIAGMGLHNVCEGIILAAAGPAVSSLVLLGAVAHKLPEGMVVFSLTDRLSNSKRWSLAAALSLLIPLGTVVAVPDVIQKPILGLAAGVLLTVLGSSLVKAIQASRLDATLLTRRAVTAAIASGAALAGLTCLVI